MFRPMFRCFIFASVLLMTLGSLAQALGFRVQCRPSLVEVGAGDDAALSCSLEPAFDVSDQTMKWSLNWTTETILVHAIMNGADPGETLQQGDRFKNRTRLDRDGLKDGSIRLKIFNVSQEDEGNYTCEVTVLKEDVYTEEGTVTLSVKPATEEWVAPPNTTEAPQDDTTSKVAIGVGLAGLVLIGFIALLIWLKKRRNGAAAENQADSPPQDSAEQQRLRDGDAENPRANHVSLQNIVAVAHPDLSKSAESEESLPLSHMRLESESSV